MARYEVPITWLGVAASLNRIDGPVYVGGMSALAEQGLAHYLEFSKQINLAQHKKAGRFKLYIIFKKR